MRTSGLRTLLVGVGAAEVEVGAAEAAEKETPPQAQYPVERG